MITAGQLRASRALLGIDQRKLAELSGLSLPTIQRMEASEGVIRGNVDSLMKLVGAPDTAGIELISDNATSAAGGRGVRLKGPAPNFALRLRRRSLWRRGAGDCDGPIRRGHAGRLWIVRRRLARDLRSRRRSSARGIGAGGPHPAARRSMARRPSPYGRAVRLLPGRRRVRLVRREPVCAWATDGMRKRRNACCRSIPRFSPP